MKQVHVTSHSGIKLNVEQTRLAPETALQPVFDEIDTHQGAIFSSGFDYPGRHSRWDIGFVNPALEFVTRNRSFTVRALNDQGTALLLLARDALVNHDDLVDLTINETAIAGAVRISHELFSEEERCHQPSVFSVLRALIDHFHFQHADISHLGFYGAFGFDLIHQFETLQLKHSRTDTPADCHLFFPLEIIVVDRKKELASKFRYSFHTPAGETAKLAGGGTAFEPPQRKEALTITCDHQPGEFAKKVEEVIDRASRGDYFEVVLSQSFHGPFSGKPTALFRRLARINPSPYMFLINLGAEQLVGASPEMFVRVTGNRYETCPIAGTVARGNSAVEDADRVRELLSSKKEESELTMCTDVDRNDMARVCVPGSVRVIGRRQLEFYSHLIHTVDHLEGTLAAEYSALDAFQTHMWACTVTGAPKLAAMQAIEQLEASPRGWYSGAIGFLDVNGDINTGITLRTAHLRNGTLSVRAGATLLYESNPALEEQETRTKAAAFLQTLAEESNPAEDKPVPINIPSSEFCSGLNRRVLLVDYQDSFVHNLAAYFRTTGAAVTTYRAGFSPEALQQLKPDLVVLSPGPGTPDDFDMRSLVQVLADRKIPTFGVCLGHQGIGQFFGATLATLSTPVHGKSSQILHNNSPLFASIPSPFFAGRYHSLYLVDKTIPACLEVTAKSGKDEGNPAIIMGIQHRTLPIAGIQFHPESIMTQREKAGLKIIDNLFKLFLREMQ